MDPIQYQEILQYSQRSSKLQVNSSGNVVMMPAPQLIEAQSPTDLSEHVTTHILTPEQLQQAVTDSQGHVPECMVNDGLELGATDESLTDLQPEDSDGEEEEVDGGIRCRTNLTPEQQKLEFMAAVNLVPPAVLEDIHRRQKRCRAEYGNWWDRQHSTDFCLVPKSTTLQNNTASVDPMSDSQFDNQSYPLIENIREDQTQVAAGPDAESMVEQITYLTSWPASSFPSENNDTMEAITMPTTSMSILGDGAGCEGRQGSHASQLQHGVGREGVMTEGNYHMMFRDYSAGNQH